jgi:hypothetical protein
MTKRNLILSGLISASCIAFPNASQALSLTLAPTDFQLSTQTPSGVIDTAASINGTLNTSLLENGTNRTQAQQIGNGGFSTNGSASGSVFTGTNGSGPTFLSIGGLGTQTIGSSLGDNNSRAITTNGFQLDQASISNGLRVTFNYVFAGYIGKNKNSQFDVQLSSDSAGTTNLLDFITTVTLTNATAPVGQGTFQSSSGTGVTGTISSADLATLGYALNQTVYFSINVNEPSSSPTTNTVAGFQQIVVSNATPVPFDFDPSTSVLILGAGFGLNKFRMRLKAKKESKV